MAMQGIASHGFPCYGAGMSTGVVKWVNAVKGYGFIAREDGSFLYFHRSAVSGDLPGRGERVRFLEGPGGRGPKAVTVEPESLPIRATG